MQAIAKVRLLGIEIYKGPDFRVDWNTAIHLTTVHLLPL